MTITLTWPASIPLPTFAGYEPQEDAPISRSDVEQGEAIQRLTSTATMTVIPVQFELTAYQLALFDAWRVRYAKQGAVWFLIPLINGLGITDHVARFMGKLSMPARNGQRWRVTATLEVRDRPMLDAASLDLLLDVPEAELFRLGNDLHCLLPQLTGLP